GLGAGRGWPRRRCGPSLGLTWASRPTCPQRCSQSPRWIRPIEAMGRARSKTATGPAQRLGGGRRMGPSPGYREELRVVLADMLDGRPDTRPGLMFGFPAFYAAGKLVACVYGTGLGLRLPPEEAAELRGRTSRTFEPYGRTM